MQYRKIVLCGISAVVLMASFPLLAKHVPNGFYINVGGGGGYFKVKKTKLKTTPDIQESGQEAWCYDPDSDFVIKPTMGEGKFGIHYKIAAGYANDTLPLRFDLSYLKTDTDYKQDNFFELGANPQIETFKNKVTSSAMMLNGYVDMLEEFERFMPYVTVGFGYASDNMKWSGTSVINLNDTSFNPPVNRTLSNPISGNTKTNTLAWQVGIGTRIKIANNLFADLCFQHVDLGKVEMGNIIMQDSYDPYYDIQVTMEPKSIQLTNDQVTLSLTAFFGDQSKPAPGLI